MEAITTSQRRPWPRPAGPVELADAQAVADGDPPWLEYWALLSRWWLAILIVTLVAASATWCFSKYYMQKWYRADAIVTPVAKPLTPGSSTLMGSSGAGSLIDLLGGSVADTSAQEYMSILKSYAFTVSMAERHQPVAAFALDVNGGLPLITPWQLYSIVNGHFGCDYNVKTGNLALSFVAKTRDEAQRILTYYVDDLRDKLRGREVHEATVAVDSLRDEINKTSDSLLQSQLYELMASQLQRQKLAQVEADFAFTVIEPPVVADNAYKPHPTRNTLLVVIFVPALMVATIRGCDRISQVTAAMRRRNSAAGRSAGEAPPSV